MTDVAPQVAAEVVTAPIKPTTADDLLSMYEEEAAPAEESVEEVKTASVATPAPKEKAAEPTTAKEEAAKILKAKYQDKDLDIPEEATFVAQLDGKDVKIKAKEAVDFYLNREKHNREIDRRYSLVDKKEKQYEYQTRNLVEKSNEIFREFQKGDSLSGVKALAKLLGKDDPESLIAVEKAFLEQSTKYGKLFGEMTEEQRQQFFLSRKAEVLEEELKRKATAESRERGRAALVNHINELRQQHGIEESEFLDTYGAMREHSVGEGKDFKSINDIGPEHVVAQIRVNRHWNKVITAAKEAGLASDAAIEEVAKLTASSPNLEIKDIVDLIKKSGIVLPRQSVENLNRKVAKSSNGAAQSRQANSTKNEKAEGYDRDDLDYLYRKGPKGHVPLKYR